MAAELEIGCDSLTSSMNLCLVDGKICRTATMKSRHQQQRAATKQKHKADEPKPLKKVIFSSVKAPKLQHQQSVPEKTCVCAPTSHPGSFRCRLHRNEQTPGLEEKAPEQRRYASASTIRKRFFSGDGVRSNYQQPRPSRFSKVTVEEADQASSQSTVSEENIADDV